MSTRLRRTVTSGASTLASVRLPCKDISPFRQISRRVLIAFALMALTVLVVYVGRSGYRDSGDDGRLSVIDAIYYATVSLTTTGYGDIVPVAESARLINILLITPLRVAFLVVLVGTTLEVLASRSREEWRIARWRRRLRDHTVVVGYGTKGRRAIETLISGGIPAEQIVVVDPSPEAAHEANANGYVGVVGDGTRADVLRRAGVSTAKRVLVTTYRDDTAVLVTLTARQLNPGASIISAVREVENKPLLEQSGANVVVTSSDAVGRLVGLATVSPPVGIILEDLLSYGEGLEVATRPALPREIGKAPRELDDVAVGVVRDGEVFRYYDPTVSRLIKGDQVVVVRPAAELPWAPRPTEETEPPPEHDDDGDGVDDAKDRN